MFSYLSHTMYMQCPLNGDANISGIFIYIHAFYIRIAKSQASLCICADSPETSLFGNGISTKIAYSGILNAEPKEREPLFSSKELKCYTFGGMAADSESSVTPHHVSCMCYCTWMPHPILT